MRSYCTLFDHSYLSRGLALYDSLLQYENEAMLYILAMDDVCYNKLKELKLDNAVIISEDEFETEELKRLKKERGRGEYCWTCTSFLIEYVLDKYKVGLCTYLDSDIFFFHSPNKIFEEMESYSVLITPHNFAEYCDFSSASGRYCVQFLPFLDNKQGREVLEDWKQKCIQCCELAPEKGHCGDQKYLDDWCGQFAGVCETENPGVGVAPWNAARFRFKQKKGQVFISEKERTQELPLIFYHFHGLKFFDGGGVLVTAPGYIISDEVIEYIYKSYFRKIEEIHSKYDLGSEVDYDGTGHCSSADSWKNNYYLLSEMLSKNKEGRY